MRGTLARPANFGANTADRVDWPRTAMLRPKQRRTGTSVETTSRCRALEGTSRVMAPDNRTGAFFRFGSFSHINNALLHALQREMEEVAISDHDVRGPTLANKPAIAMAALQAALASPLALFRKGPRTSALLRSPAIRSSLADTIRDIVRNWRQQPSFTLQTQSLFNAKQPGVPNFVYTDHTQMTNLRYPTFDDSKLAPAELIDQEREIYAQADAVFVMSQHVGDSLLEDYQLPADRIINARAGCNADTASIQRKHAVGTAKRIIFVGVEWERKGGPELVAACERARARHPDIHLTIVGCSPKVEAPHIDVVGRIPLAEVMDRLADADLFCMPSRIEPFGIATIEAMAAGLPILAPDLGAFPDFVETGKTGALVPPGDIEAMADALDTLFSDPERLAEMGATARARIAADYTWQHCAETIAATISERAGFAAGRQVNA